jgi:glutathionyl-hydroquinone reductase
MSQQMWSGKVCEHDHPQALLVNTIGRTQAAYEKSVIPLFRSLDRVENMLKNSTGPYILGNQLTEVDIRLYPTIVRFDIVYVSV